MFPLPAINIPFFSALSSSASRFRSPTAAMIILERYLFSSIIAASHAAAAAASVDGNESDPTADLNWRGTVDRGLRVERLRV